MANRNAGYGARRGGFWFYRSRSRTNESSGARVEFTEKTRRQRTPPKLIFCIQLRGQLLVQYLGEKQRQYVNLIDLERWSKAAACI